MHARRPWTRRLADGMQELSRTPVRFAIKLAVARLVTQWRSLLTLIAGTILSALIGALVPLYTTAISQVGMTQRLADEPARDVHIAASINLRANQWANSAGANPDAVGADTSGLAAKAQGATAITQTLVDENLGVIDGWVADTVVFAETEAMGVIPVTTRAPTESLSGVRARLGTYSGWQQQIRIVAGRMPESSITDTIDILIGLNVANELNLQAGDVITLDQGMRPNGTTGGGHPTSRPVTAHIVGIYAPQNEDDPFWMEPSPLRLLDRASGAAPWSYQFVALTTEDTVMRIATEYIPDTPTRIGWRILFAHDNLPFERIDTARAALDLFARNMRAAYVDAVSANAANSQSRLDLGYTYHTRLIDFDTNDPTLDHGILQDYANRQALLAAPFGLLLMQVGALVLFFLIVTAALVRRGERREIAMLQSRGAWNSQIMLLRGIEALLICLLAIGIAPLLAQRLLTWLGPIVANTHDFPLPLTGRVFGYAALAAGVTFVTLTGTLYAILQQPLILAGGAATRQTRQTWWQKYYLDAILAVVGLAALVLLVRRGSPLTDVNLGGQQADPMLLMAPALLFLALGSLALRFFPLVAALLARITAQGRGLLNVLASWQLSREPVHYGRITFLLALAIGIGWFATSFRATVTNSHLDQAQYRVGTDVRFNERDTQLNVNRARALDAYTRQPEVAAASRALRFPSTNLSTSIQGSLRGTILAIDPGTFGDTLYWRADLGDLSTLSKTASPDDLPARGAQIPVPAAKIGLWARYDQLVSSVYAGGDPYQADVTALTQNTTLYLRLLDAAGAWVVVPVQPVEVDYQRVGHDQPGLGAAATVTSGWVQMEADLTALDYAPVYPLRLVSIYWNFRSADPKGADNNRLTLAHLSLTDDTGEEVVRWSILAHSGWEFAYDHGASAIGTALPGIGPFDAHPDALIVTWSQDAQRTTIGALLAYPATDPLDAIVSRRMQSQNGLTYGLDAAPFRVYGIGGSNLYFRAVDITEYYPSLYDTTPNDAVPQGDSFMVVNVHELLYQMNRRPSATFYADEVWLRFDAGVLNPRDQDAVGAFVLAQDSADADRVVVVASVSVAHELSRLRTDPLSLGLLGLMYLAFIIALALSVVGLLTYAGLTAQARRAEFGVLRALGLSSRRVVGSLALEQLFVMGIGALLGGVLGGVLAAQVVPTLALGAAGEGITPPFVMRVETRRLVEYALLMIGVLALVLSTSLLLIRQLSLARTLRLGDE